MSLISRKLFGYQPTFTLLLMVFWGLMVAVSSAADGATNKKSSDKVAFASVTGQGKTAKKPPQRYPKPAFVGKFLPQQIYRGITLIGAENPAPGAPSNALFYRKTRAAIELIAIKAPDIFTMLKNINPQGRRVVYYTGKNGPASFTSWKKDYVVNLTATGIHEDPVFENTVYSLAATLVHELVGHGRQEADNRVWLMYDWCGRDSSEVDGVLWQANHKGASSGFVEYEANLFAKWFLESVRGHYPNLNEPAVRRYVKVVRLIKRRFPGWYDDRKMATALLADFGSRFAEVCPGHQYTPHPVPAK